MQGLFHSYKFILYFFGQLMHFCKSTRVVLQQQNKDIFEALTNFIINGVILVGFEENMPKTCPSKALVQV
jgi:hypothetical protein